MSRGDVRLIAAVCLRSKTKAKTPRCISTGAGSTGGICSDTERTSRNFLTHSENTMMELMSGRVTASVFCCLDTLSRFARLTGARDTEGEDKKNETKMLCFLFCFLTVK